MFWKLLALVAVIAFGAAVYWAVSPVFRSGKASDGDKQQPSATPAGTPGPNDPVLVGAGDISSCAQDNDTLTADLLDQVVASATGEVVVFTAGDNAYESGSIEEYQQCYDPTWGRQKARTRPVLGNHEYASGNANGYLQYYGAMDTEAGIRQLVVGRGGEGHYRESDSRLPNSEAANDDTFGVLKLTLHPAGYDWEFMPEGRHGRFSDSGSGTCHGPPPIP